MSFTRPHLLRLTRAINPARPHPHPQTRRYATAPGPSQGGSNSTWYFPLPPFLQPSFPPKHLTNKPRLVISAALAIPAGYYLLSGNSLKTSKSSSEQVIPSTRKEAAGGNQSSMSPSELDSPSTRKEAADGNMMSGKQEGLSNATSDHPYINEPGKSVKGEGETETAKVKGTVSTKRPQQ
ncbi:hypothetical protein BDV12DRAFT_172504 [Aspergillus spectabilis]